MWTYSHIDRPQGTTSSSFSDITLLLPDNSARVEIVRIGIIGAGTMGQCAHLRNYAITPGCKVVALAELRPKLANAVAQRCLHGVVPSVTRRGDP